MKFNPSINLILKDGIEIKKYLKKAQKNNSSVFELNYKTRDLIHETRITSYKENQNKLRSLIIDQLNVKGLILKKKKTSSQLIKHVVQIIKMR